MNTPFPSHDDPFTARPDFGPGCGPGFGFGPGFDPMARRALHEQRRQARRAFRDQVRDQMREHRGIGPGGPGPGFGPGGFGPFGPGGPGFGFGPGGRGGRRGGPRGGGRGKRSDVRAAILVLLTERSMHGYEMIQEIGERSQQLWKPSPGSVYPTLQLLVDEGLIVSTDAGGTKKLFELTDDGRAAAEKIETAPWDEITEGADPNAVNLRTAVGQLMGAIAQSAHAASSEQQQRILDIVNNARREIYQILGESE